MSKIFRLKIFVWYLFTEPFRFVWDTVKAVVYGLHSKNTTKNWAAIYVALLVGAIMAENKFTTLLCGITLIILIIYNEWRSGKFMYRWRQTRKKKIDGGN
jgi:hypothetical protein